MRPEVADRIRKAIAAIQFVGGVLGGLIVIWAGPRIAEGAHVSLVQVLPWLIPPFVLSIVAGALLWRGGSGGDLLSITNLTLQVPVMSTPTVGYFFNSGLALRIWLSPRGPGAYMFVGSQFHIGLRENAPDVTLGVNVVALALLILLVRVMPDDTPRAPSRADVAHSA